MVGGGGVVQHHGASLAPGAAGHMLGLANHHHPHSQITPTAFGGGGGGMGAMTNAGGMAGMAMTAAGDHHGTKRGRDPEPDPWPTEARKRPTPQGFNTAAPLALPDSLYGDDGKGSALRMSTGGSSSTIITHFLPSFLPFIVSSFNHMTCDAMRAIVELRVPADRVGLIIGRGGETIKRLQDETGAHIQVGKEAEGPDRQVMVEGTPQQVATAKEEIMRIINDRPGGDRRRPGLGAAGGHYGPSSGIENSDR